MKGKKIILLILTLVAVIFITAAGVYVYTSRTPAEKKTETIILSIGDKFQTNLKDSRSIISISIQLEIQKDKKLMQTLEERNAEIRSKILDILREKTVEDVNGKTGKQNLEMQTLQYLQQSFGKEKVVSVFIDDFVVQ
ncbi:MAG: hypothetical protein HPY66_0256 [Firmicutes bacterium]|nr:hypothetical protein [Bacillota bacterium]MDI6704678.1 flagellar basal body-associated FliL family protein [Bacillota bacterium]